MSDLVGIDVGTTAVKAARFSADGRLRAHFGLGYRTHRPAPGIVEQNPNDWLQAIEEAAAALAIDAGTVAAMGICSQVNTHVFVDAHGEPLLPAIVWQDARAAAEAAELDAQISAERKLAWFGAPMPIDASHALARMAWMARHHPDLWARTRWILSPKDFCLYKLTGIAAADPISAIGLTDLSGHYVRDLLALVPGAAARLTPLASLLTVAGSVRRGRLTGARAVVGTMDAWGALFGCGVTGPGQGAYVAGTSEIVALVADRPGGAAGVVSFAPTAISGATWHVHAGPTQSGGDSLRWWAQVSGRGIAEVLALASQADRDAAPVLFLPHQEGERSPLWDSRCRAAFLNVSGRTGAAEFALAVLEGVALSGKLLHAACERAAGCRGTHLLYGGGGSVSDLWSQIRADVLGVPLHRMAFSDVGALGAAIMAGVGTGIFASVPEAAARMARVGRVFEPDAGRRDRYAAMESAYRAAYEAIKAPQQLLAQQVGQQ